MDLCILDATLHLPPLFPTATKIEHITAGCQKSEYVIHWMCNSTITYA